MMMKEVGKLFGICGVVLQFGFVVSIGGTVIGMMRGFAKIAASGDPQSEVLASDINLALGTTAGGMVLSLLGLVLLLTLLFVVEYRAPWFKTAMWIIAFLWLFSVPVGTIVGIIVMLYLSTHSDEFTGQAVPLYDGEESSLGNE